MASIGFVTRAVFVTLLLAPAAARPDPAPASPPRVRFSDRVVSAAMARGVDRSATFRRLVHRLETSDLIVHIDRRRHGGRAVGFTQFVAARGGVRYVRITILANDAGDPTVGLIGHELRHAVELADARWVRSLRDYEALYRAIGHPSCEPPARCFDTIAAADAGRHVYREMRQGRALAQRVTAGAAGVAGVAMMPAARPANDRAGGGGR